MFVLQDVGAHAVENAFGATRQRSTMAECIDAVAAGLRCRGRRASMPRPPGFDAEELDARVIGEGVGHPHCVGATADTRDDSAGEFVLELQHLLLGLVADNGLEGADDGWERVWPDGGANDVVSGGEVDDPGAHRLVDGIAEGHGAGFYGRRLWRRAA